MRGGLCRAEALSCPGLAAAPTTPIWGAWSDLNSISYGSVPKHTAARASPHTVKWGDMRGVWNATKEAGRTNFTLSLPRQVLLYPASAPFLRGPDSPGTVSSMVPSSSASLHWEGRPMRAELCFSPSPAPSTSHSDCLLNE